MSRRLPHFFFFLFFPVMMGRACRSPRSLPGVIFGILFPSFPVYFIRVLVRFFSCFFLFCLLRKSLQAMMITNQLTYIFLLLSYCSSNLDFKSFLVQKKKTKNPSGKEKNCSNQMRIWKSQCPIFLLLFFTHPEFRSGRDETNIRVLYLFWFLLFSVCRRC